MQPGQDDLSVLDRLNLALETEALPAGARDHAMHLIRRLGSPVRVGCIGLPRSGKSELINMFVGQRIIPADRLLPALEIEYADTATLSITQADGGVEEAQLSALRDDDLSRAAFLKIGMPFEILKRVKFLEVTPSGDQTAQRAAVDWAIRRTDIALWCTQSFSEPERQLWSRVPDSLKDHAFMVLTMADRLGAEGILGDRIAILNDVVAEEFHSLFPIATLHAIAAVGDDGSVDEARRQASGGTNLINEVLRHADRGRRADMDSAYLFLSRYQVRTTAEDLISDRPPAPSEPPVEVAALQPIVESPTIEEPVVAAPTDAPNAATVNVAMFEDGVRFLRRRGAGLAETAASLGPGNAKPLIDQCVDTVEHLVDLFSQDDSEDPETDAFIDELAEAAEMMVLMQVEDGDSPAADAVTLLLQLRRDMEVKLAA